MDALNHPISCRVMCSGAVDGRSHQFRQGHPYLGDKDRTTVEGGVIWITEVANPTMQESLGAVLGSGLFHGDCFAPAYGAFEDSEQW